MCYFRVHVCGASTSSAVSTTIHIWLVSHMDNAGNGQQKTKDAWMLSQVWTLVVDSRRCFCIVITVPHCYVTYNHKLFKWFLFCTVLVHLCSLWNQWFSGAILLYLWSTGVYLFLGVSRCTIHQTCKDCQADVACGWCDDGSGTGIGRCLAGGERGPISPVTGSTQTHKCSPSNWFFTECPRKSLENVLVSPVLSDDLPHSLQCIRHPTTKKKNPSTDSLASYRKELRLRGWDSICLIASTAGNQVWLFSSQICILITRKMVIPCTNSAYHKLGWLWTESGRTVVIKYRCLSRKRKRAKKDVFTTKHLQCIVLFFYAMISSVKK